MNIFPKPKKMTVYEPYTGSKAFKLTENDFSDNNLSYILSEVCTEEGSTPLTIKCNSDYSKEKYYLRLNNSGASISASTPRGVYNALSTLKQIVKNDDVFCAEIEDEPDFEDRCVLFDLVHNIKKPEEIKKVIDLLADMKYNQIQLNFDNLHFELRSFMKYCKWEEVITVEYVRELQEYCKKHFIELVPNHNSFGHMNAFLEIDEFKDLAECPDGFDRTDEYGFTYHMGPGTLNPYDERAIEFMDRLYGDLLPHFESDKFNVCCDETFELGRGKSKPIADEYGRNKVYTYYMNKLHKLCNKYGKRMFFWADMIIDSPEALRDMPKDSVAITWGYEEEHPFAEQCKALKESGLEFQVATGTSSWSNVLGRSDNALINQKNAAVEGKKNGARGYFLTDWWDCTHPHYVVNYVPYAYGAGLAWNVDDSISIEPAFDYLDDNLFGEKGFSKFMYDCGNAYKLEAYKRFNATAHYTGLYSPLNDSYYLYDQTPEHFERMIEYVKDCQKRLKDFELVGEEFKEEMALKLRVFITISKVCIYKLGDKKYKDDIIEEFLSQHDEHKRLWLKYNSEYTMNMFVDITNEIISLIKEEQGEI